MYACSDQSIVTLSFNGTDKPELAHFWIGHNDQITALQFFPSRQLATVVEAAGDEGLE